MSHGLLYLLSGGCKCDSIVVLGSFESGQSPLSALLFKHVEKLYSNPNPKTILSMISLKAGNRLIRCLLGPENGTPAFLEE